MKRLLSIEAEVVLRVPVSFKVEVPQDFDHDRDTLGLTDEVTARATACSAGVLAKLLRSGALASRIAVFEGDVTVELDDWSAHG